MTGLGGGKGVTRIVPPWTGIVDENIDSQKDVTNSCQDRPTVVGYCGCKY